jgi:hypothetical protein
VDVGIFPGVDHEMVCSTKETPFTVVNIIVFLSFQNHFCPGPGSCNTTHYAGFQAYKKGIPGHGTPNHKNKIEIKGW